MAKIYLGIGSNIQRHKYISCALDMLDDTLGPLRISSVYESASVGFDGDPFYNLAVGADTEMSLASLIKLLKEVEDSNGRDRTNAKFSSRTLDIDILTYGNLVGLHERVLLPRAEVLKQAHVLLPLSEIAATEELPGTGKECRELWLAHDKSKQSLQVVDFIWRDKQISCAP